LCKNLDFKEWIGILLVLQLLQWLLKNRAVKTGSFDGKYFLYGIYYKPDKAIWPDKVDSKLWKPIHKLNNFLVMKKAEDGRLRKNKK